MLMLKARIRFWLKRLKLVFRILWAVQMDDFQAFEKAIIEWDNLRVTH